MKSLLAIPLIANSYGHIGHHGQSINPVAQMLGNPECNRECLQYCLNYFPVSNAAEKCGCTLDYDDKGLDQSNNNEFLKHEFAKDEFDPIIAEYNLKLRKINGNILNGVTNLESSQPPENEDVQTSEESDTNDQEDSQDTTQSEDTSNNDPDQSQSDNQADENQEESNNNGQSEDTETNNDTENGNDDSQQSDSSGEESENNDPDQQPSDPQEEVLDIDSCPEDDENCLEYMSQCTATCNQKCRTEPLEAQTRCNNLCIKQCMASFGIQLNEQPHLTRAAIHHFDQNQLLSRVQTHATTLIQQGAWCSPSCISTCGNMILSQQTKMQDKIVSCFKDTCNCKNQQVYIDEEQLLKYHADMRVEHLLLEKDVQDMMLAIKAAQRQDTDKGILMLSQTDDVMYYKNMENSSAVKVHNELLETIIQESLQGSQFDTTRTNFVGLARLSGVVCIIVAISLYFLKKYNYVFKNIDGVEINVKNEQTNNRDTSRNDNDFKFLNQNKNGYSGQSESQIVQLEHIDQSETSSNNERPNHFDKLWRANSRTQRAKYQSSVKQSFTPANSELDNISQIQSKNLSEKLL